MNQKGGMYGVAIGLMAIALLGFSVFSVQGQLEEEQTHSYVGVMSDVRMSWQNTVMILDDAMEDAILDNTCAALTGAGLKTNYLDPAITQFNADTEPGPHCEFSPIAGSFSIGATLIYHADVVCEREIVVDGETIFKARYTKTFNFENTC